MNDLETRKTYMLQQAVFYIGRTYKKSLMCAHYKWRYSSTKTFIDVHINCSSWDKNYYRVFNIWDSNPYHCSVIGAQCDLLDYHCVCHCYPGYVMVNGTCLKENLTVGSVCADDRQCTGTKFATCIFGVCTCRSGYILIDYGCFKENVTVGNECIYDWQCTGTEFAGLCRSGVCTCQAGFILINNSCDSENVTVGNACIYDWQCTGTEFASLCRSGVCTCKKGYLFIDNNCYHGNLSLNQICVTNHRGSASDNNGYHSRQQQDQKVATILGTLFGGVFLGAIITTFITKRARIKCSPYRREQSIEMFASNAMYCSPSAVARASSQNN
ncbi:multiple epidermal growth factor-like domains protein 10 [Magallana gigas]|uniref:multiple epidermal growth factor-like domains protein 10 n=1 Tax=Magallana gigas TaxID=29159 RepID=UPI00333F0948